MISELFQSNYPTFHIVIYLIFCTNQCKFVHPKQLLLYDSLSHLKGKQNSGFDRYVH